MDDDRATIISQIDKCFEELASATDRTTIDAAIRRLMELEARLAALPGGKNQATNRTDTPE